MTPWRSADRSSPSQLPASQHKGEQLTPAAFWSTLAVVAAPIAAALIFEALVQIWMAPSSIEISRIIGLSLCCSIVVMFALPLFTAFERRGRAHWWIAALIGFFTGAYFGMLLSIFDSESASRPYFEALALGGSGAVGGLVFWCVWRQGRKAPKS